MPGKYALVLWVASNSTSIVPISAIHDNSLLENSARVGKICAAILGKKEPTNGWKKHDGRVISVDDKLTVLKSLEERFIDSDEDMDSEEGRGQREIKRKRFHEEEEDEREDEEGGAKTNSKPTAKLVKRAKHVQGQTIINKLVKMGHTSEEAFKDTQCANCASLNARIKELEKRNEVLSKGLPGVVEELNKVVRGLRLPASKPTTTSIPSTCSRAPSEAGSSSSDANNSTEDYELGAGLTLPVHVLKRCTHSDFKKLTRDLMCALFTREQMTVSSVMGKKGVGVHAAKECRPALPQDRVQAIMFYVIKKFPSVENGQIRQVMAYKLKDIRATNTKAER